jgi:tRNA pseudouridine32 synthase / 23S rRNA pseudouridine746 synthase
MQLPDLIVHEDDRLIALDKPPGLASAPAASPDEPSLQALVTAYLGRRALIVHRLDRHTSGVIVFAKDADEHRRLSGLFEAHEVEKTYLAVVLGHLDPPSGEIDRPLRAFGSGRVGVDPRGKPARTRYAVTERLRDADLVELVPESGRRHQLRVHCFALGHPILGDPRYGSPRPVGGAARLMLHATRLALPDRVGGRLVIEAAPGSDFDAILAGQR